MSIHEYVSMRNRTDYIMPLYTPFIPTVILVISYIIFPLFTSYTTYTLFLIEAFTYLIGALVNIYVLYKWIKRRNQHFMRITMLLYSIADYLSTRYKINVSRLRELAKEHEIRFRERFTALWIILSILFPIVTLYVYHFLTRDFYNHEELEDRFLEELNECLKDTDCGPLNYQRINRIPYRRTWLYALISIFSLGVFMFYWVYVITNDPNKHFKEHVRWEDMLVDKFRI